MAYEELGLMFAFLLFFVFATGHCFRQNRAMSLTFFSSKCIPVLKRTCDPVAWLNNMPLWMFPPSQCILYRPFLSP